MSRLKRATTILDAAERWKRQCLLDGGSLFNDEALWTKKFFDELQRYFVERPDTSKRGFFEKLQEQLAPASPQAKHLFGEILWLYYLIVANPKAGKKLAHIRRVWEWSGAELPQSHWALDEILDKGFVFPGPGYGPYRWLECKYIITKMLEWLSIETLEDRESLLNDPWRFAEWIYPQEGDPKRQFPHALLFLLFPDQFEPIVTQNPKKEIVKHFGEKLGESHQPKNMSLIEVDKALLKIREQLEDGHPREEINFYSSPWKELWQGDPSKPNDNVGEADNEVWYANRFGSADIWILAPGKGARLWEEFLETGIAAIGWDNLGDLGEYTSREAIHDALVESGAGLNPYNQSLAAWEFAHEMNIGDFVLVKQGRRLIIGWGKVTGEYAYKPERAEYPNVRSVDWRSCRIQIKSAFQLATKTLTKITWDKALLRSVFEFIDSEARKESVDPDGGEDESYDPETALRDLFMDDTKFHRILDSIKRRKNLILQGPPGVGKTFIARRIAWCLMGRKDTQSIGMVQFHQSYSYEDFVQGWRPTETGGFTLRDGVFYQFCKLAEEHPEKPFVFIIDEINRGNLSRIFGELLMLIEADKRGPEHAITLTYGASGDEFNVPENVYLLGLMNTADRSLAIVDYALRRRFAFETLEPAYGTEKFREHLLEAEIDRNLVDRIERNLLEINNLITDDKDLGPGFQIGHSYFVPEEQADEQWYLDIVETQIVPLLREYWFDRPSHVNRLTEILRQ